MDDVSGSNRYASSGLSLTASPTGRLAGQAEDSLAEDVAHDVAGAAHDRVRRAVGDGPVEVVVGDRFHAEHRGGEVGDMLLMFGAEALGGGGEAGRRLLQRLAVDEHPA